MRAWVVLFVVSLLPLACEEGSSVGQTSESAGAGSGTTSSSSSGMTGPACGDLGDTFLDADCRACAHDGCCDELVKCDASDACIQRYGCERSCGGDEACRATCAATYPEGQAAGDLVRCLGSCSDVCAPPSNICNTTISAGNPDCDQCLGEYCCSELSACLAETSCEHCIQSGDAIPCAGDSSYDAVMACFSSQCTSACDG